MPRSPINSCCFTGHRIIPTRDLQKLRYALSTEIRYLHSRGIRYFISGGAIGFDTVAAEEVLALKGELEDIHLVLAIPCLDQDAKWTPAQKEKGRRIRELADEIIYTGQKYTSDCMHVRNRFMVDSSCVCLSYCTRQSGGTYYTVRYADQRGLSRCELSERIKAL